MFNAELIRSGLMITTPLISFQQYDETPRHATMSRKSTLMAFWISGAVA